MNLQRGSKRQLQVHKKTTFGSGDDIDGLTFFYLDALGLEEVPEPADLVLELPDELGVAVLVHHRLAHDLLGSAHKKEHRQLALKIRKK
jgi:hypothetical protein